MERRGVAPACSVLFWVQTHVTSRLICMRPIPGFSSCSKSILATNFSFQRLCDLGIELLIHTFGQNEYSSVLVWICRSIRKCSFCCLNCFMVCYELRLFELKAVCRRHQWLVAKDVASHTHLMVAACSIIPCAMYNENTTKVSTTYLFSLAISFTNCLDVLLSPTAKPKCTFASAFVVMTEKVSKERMFLSICNNDGKSKQTMHVQVDRCICYHLHQSLVLMCCEVYDI